MEHCVSHEKCVDDISKINTQIALCNSSIDAQDERITKHKQDWTDVMSAFSVKLDRLYDAIIGTADKKGLKQMVDEHEAFLAPQRNAMNSIINGIYKASMVSGMVIMVWLLVHRG